MAPGDGMWPTGEIHMITGNTCISPADLVVLLPDFSGQDNSTEGRLKLFVCVHPGPNPNCDLDMWEAVFAGLEQEKARKEATATSGGLKS